MTGAKVWKLSPMDLQSYNLWDGYTRARDEMFAASDTPWAPGYVARSDDKRRARLNIIAHLLSKVKYKKVVHETGSCRSAKRAKNIRLPTTRLVYR